ncbi:MAG: hypothetical protein OEZ39_20340, partial [Gammaproteobacteria bacterium]|nr:hypothetical protein [Gammaproteobacteria bacterium]
MDRKQTIQLFRLLDVFVIGPFMIYSAIRERNKYFKSGMMVAGLATIGHSGLAYLADKRGVQGAALPYAEPVAWTDVTPEPAT